MCKEVIMRIWHKIRLLFSPNRESYLCYYDILGFMPRDIELYKQALRHKSMIKELKGKPHNERMEFLGDAIIDAVVADMCYEYFIDEREGFLTSTRSKIVQRASLDKLAVQLGLDKLVSFTGVNRMTQNNHINGNALEAFVGAIYLDRGYAHCKRFIIERMIRPHIDLDEMSKKVVNFKSLLIEWSQKRRMALSYELIRESKDSKGVPVFYTEVQIEEIPVGSGEGNSKKVSQQHAAKAALERIKGDASLLQEFIIKRDARLSNSAE